MSLLLLLVNIIIIIIIIIIVSITVTIYQQLIMHLLSSNLLIPMRHPTYEMLKVLLILLILSWLT